MSLQSIVQESLDRIARIVVTPDGLYVTTHCLYPSNQFVRVVVRGGENTFVVSDEGGAFREIEAAGAPEIHNPDGMAKHLVIPHGLRISNGVIRSPEVSKEALPIALSLVANVSKEVADYLFQTVKIKRQRNFRQLLRQFLEQTFDNRMSHDQPVIGKSNKAHKFDNVILMPGGRRLIVDAAVRDPASINARLVANLDVREAHHPDIEQRIVYDDQDEWRPEELTLLGFGAPLVRFSQSEHVIQRIASGH